MVINEQIKNLVNEQRNLFEGKTIAFDGIVDEEIFCTSQYRVMALLKECNDNGTIDNWEKYMEYICNEAKTDRQNAHWTNLNYWIEALYHQDKSFAECTDNKFCYRNRLNENMLKISVVNVKKTPGKGQSDMKEIVMAAGKNKELLQNEISLIAPKLVICGGTYECAKIIYDKEKATDIHLPCGLAYFIEEDKNGNKMMFIDFMHPSIRGIRANVLYAYAKTAFAEASDKMQETGII